MTAPACVLRTAVDDLAKASAEVARSHAERPSSVRTVMAEALHRIQMSESEKVADVAVHLGGTEIESIAYQAAKFARDAIDPVGLDPAYRRELGGFTAEEVTLLLDAARTLTRVAFQRSARERASRADHA